MATKVSRRGFLGGTAALAAGLALARMTPASAQVASGARRPVLLVHGFGDRADVWRRSDNALTGRLAAAGYRPDVDLLPFRYPELPGLPGAEDSEGDIGAIGRALAGAIRSAAAASSDGQVDVLSFSMGGLVSRAAINALRSADGGAGRSLVNTAVLVAAPNAGADVLLWFARLNPRGQATVVELGRELFGLNLDSVAARQMLPQSAFLAELNRPDWADDRVRYVTIAGSVRMDLQILGMTTGVEVGDGLISPGSAAFLPGVAARAYVLRDELAAGGSLVEAVRRSYAFHGGLLFNDTVGLAAAAELAPDAAGLRAELDRRLGDGAVALAAPA